VGRIKLSSRSSTAALAVTALVAALAGTALAGPDATISELSKKKVKRVATKQATKQVNALAPALADAQIDRRAPDLSVANAANAGTAATAQAAANASALGGKAASEFATDFEVVREQSETSSAETRSVLAKCPAGKTVIGGGARVMLGGSFEVAINSSGPILADESPTDGNSWHAFAAELVATTQQWALRSYAYCARVTVPVTGD
jgi:hypothetical protein